MKYATQVLAASMICLAVSEAVCAAGPLDEVLKFCRDDTGAPSNTVFMAIIMPDGKPRGTRSAADLTTKAREARDAGDCSKAVEWILHCADHDEGAKNVLRADPSKTCSAL